jgi:polyisoprenoid-binding protein YceI
VHKTLRSIAVSSLVSLFVVGAASSAIAADWELDPSHSHVGFGIKHMMISTLHGTFNKYTGTVTLDDKDPSKVAAHIVIETASVDTGDAKRDEHLKSPDFFDAAQYPKIIFDAVKAEKRGADGLAITGNLTIKSVTKPVVLAVSGITQEVKDPWGGLRKGATATAKINRKDFGLTWNKSLDSGGVLVGDDVNIELELELTKAKKKDKS